MDLGCTALADAKADPAASAMRHRRPYRPKLSRRLRTSESHFRLGVDDNRPGRCEAGQTSGLLLPAATPPRLVRATLETKNAA